MLISRALSPAKPLDLYIDDDRSYCIAIFDDDDLELAIGRAGVNVNLAANVTNYKWGGKGKLYDRRNQYVVACRLVKEKRVEPFFGEDSVKCHYRCQDYKEVRDEFVITTHSDHTCMKQVTQPRGDKRDWRSK